MQDIGVDSVICLDCDKCVSNGVYLSTCVCLYVCKSICQSVCRSRLWVIIVLADDDDGDDDDDVMFYILI